MVDASAALKGRFYVAQTYDISGAYAISFMWYGAGIKTDLPFRIETPTGDLHNMFSDWPEGWREVYLPMSSFNKVGSAGLNPDLKNVTGFFWTVFNEGLRKLGRIKIIEQPELKCRFVVRQESAASLKGSFTVA
jgi:hypothetical protein